MILTGQNIQEDGEILTESDTESWVVGPVRRLRLMWSTSFRCQCPCAPTMQDGVRGQCQGIERCGQQLHFSVFWPNGLAHPQGAPVPPAIRRQRWSPVETFPNHDFGKTSIASPGHGAECGASFGPRRQAQSRVCTFWTSRALAPERTLARLCREAVQR